MKLIIAFFLLIFIAACSDEKVKPTIDPTIVVAEIPAQESWNATIIFTDSGKTKAILTAGHLRVYTQSQETLLDSNIKIDFYNEFEQKTTTLTAKRGRVDDATQDLYAMDDVVAVNDSGVTITTDELMWRNKDQLIVSDKFVTIISPQERIEGYGFESDQHLRNYTIYRITYVTRREESD
jgi:LPS export ABC transporter protein LptC